MLAPGEPPPPAEGTRVRVVFSDGRQVAGLSPDFSPTAPGFFVIPVDVRSNTGRVWVFRDAVRQVSVG
jgi:DNA/RNA-binding domain of Phe-tRNA-synthetase-like protein